MNLVMPTEIKARKRLVKAWHNPYTAKEAITREQLLSYNASGPERRQARRCGPTRRNDSPQRNGLRTARTRYCESNGKPLHPSEVEMDHIILRAKFKDAREADRMKHLQPVCTSCHRAKTKTDLKVLSRMTVKVARTVRRGAATRSRIGICYAEENQT